MSLQEITLELDPSILPDPVRDLIDEADKRCDQFFEAGLGLRYPRYVPSDPTVAHAAIAFLEQQGLLRGKVFCEWGCGFATVTGIASLLGFEAYGIELEPELAELGSSLTGELGIPAEILNISYFPEGYDESEGVGGKDLIIPESHHSRGPAPPSPSYQDLDPDEVDLFYVYPWPGQERLMMDLFISLSSPGAILLIYNGEGEISAYLHDESGNDVAF